MSSGRLRVLLAHTVLSAKPRGLGLYGLRLAAALARRDDVEALLAAPLAPPEGSGWVRVPRHRKERRLFDEAFLAGRLASREGVDVYHGLYSSVPLRCPVPRVATVHDVIWRLFPRMHAFRTRTIESSLARLACRAERIVVPSQRAAEDFLRFYGYPRERVRVIGEAPRDGQQPVAREEVDRVLAQTGIERPYLVCAGGGDAHKRVVDVVRAVAALREQGELVQLAVTGRPGAMGKLLEREAGRLGLGREIVYTGYVDIPELDALLSGATALVFPSLYEGFGLPPLEAMACGTPVITTALEPMTDVLGDAALFVPPRDPGAIAKAVSRLIHESGLADDYRGRGLECAGRYSWDRAAAEHMEVYHEVARL